MYKSKYKVSTLISGNSERAETVAVTAQRRHTDNIEWKQGADAQAGAEQVMVVIAVEVTAMVSESLAAQNIAVVELVVSSRTDVLATGKSRPCELPKT